MNSKAHRRQHKNTDDAGNTAHPLHRVIPVGNRRYARGRAYARDHYAEGQAAASEAEQTLAAEAPEGKQESTE